MSKNKTIPTLAAVTFLLLSSCSNEAPPSDIPESPFPGQIYLYGEAHGVDIILDKEFELWHDYYHNRDMRHLFIELSYYTAEFLNMWMKADGDEILDTLYQEWSGTASHTPVVKEFYITIKTQCPETIFHGTDIGHQFASTGKRFLKYLRNSKLEDSEQYLLAKEAIEQGKRYYRHYDDVFRENAMVKNFIREYDKLNGESIMGIYGAAHTGLEALDHTNSVPCMANQLTEFYGDTIQSEDLSRLEKDIEPIRLDTIQVAGIDCEALYFGKEDLAGFKEYSSREFWRLENRYAHFADRPKTGDVLPYSNYPMLIEEEQVFVIDYTKTDGTVTRKYYRSDGRVWQEKPSTEEFTVQ